MLFLARSWLNSLANHWKHSQQVIAKEICKIADNIINENLFLKDNYNGN